MSLSLIVAKTIRSIRSALLFFLFVDFCVFRGYSKTYLAEWLRRRGKDQARELRRVFAAGIESSELMTFDSWEGASHKKHKKTQKAQWLVGSRLNEALAYCGKNNSEY